ncbi:hypothetical protein NXS98_03230 [Fontisphaera persica]|uniref:hypothetical protein n=1 Tax=Fontisphaera persica TaxID=2974023 RepID=UPI0024C07186|nr:hypothetical protein [Fontisphaera persica]WCJ60153.1 hypothetical protein NXS98_03230 [Fontisphaera persica]
MKKTAMLLSLSLLLAANGWSSPDPAAQPQAEKDTAAERERWALHLQRALEQAVQDMRDALDTARQKVAEAPKLLAQTVGAIRRERGRQMPVRPIRTLVASSRLAEASKIQEMEEDLAVMSRLLAKDVEFELRNDENRPMNVVITSFGDQGQAPEALYLEGFGAFFYLTVPFPLLPEAEKSGKTDLPPMDSDWDRTRAELFGGAVPEPGRRGNVWAGGGEPPPPPPYDAEKVEDLKRVLLSSLRNAVNIRGMKPEDWVHVSVHSFPRATAGPGVGVSVGQMTVTTTQDGKTVTRTYSGGNNPPRQGLLNLRVKHSDLQTYAEGKMTLEDLRKKAQISLY